MEYNMYGDALFALWFFVPAGIANLAPILAAKAPFLKGWNQPIDGGRIFRGKRLLGSNKTWRGLVCGVIAGSLAFWIQTVLFAHSQTIRNLSEPLNYNDNMLLFLGPLMGFGALSGDAVKSFFKRQFDVDSGRSWLPWDQVDYIIGGLLWTTPVVRLSLSRYAWVILIWAGIHFAASYVGYLTKHKAEPI
jgi:CDP-2,3-bis-(O-geranylgeranyl)-sn-glycerol synthase